MIADCFFQGWLEIDETHVERARIFDIHVDHLRPRPTALNAFCPMPAAAIPSSRPILNPAGIVEGSQDRRAFLTPLIMPGKVSSLAVSPSIGRPPTSSSEKF
jgi:hypothetical protein